MLSCRFLMVILLLLGASYNGYSASFSNRDCGPKLVSELVSGSPREKEEEYAEEILEGSALLTGSEVPSVVRELVGKRATPIQVRVAAIHLAAAEFLSLPETTDYQNTPQEFRDQLARFHRREIRLHELVQAGNGVGLRGLGGDSVLLRLKGIAAKSRRSGFLLRIESELRKTNAAMSASEVVKALRNTPRSERVHALLAILPKIPVVTTAEFFQILRQIPGHKREVAICELSPRLVLIGSKKEETRLVKELSKLPWLHLGKFSTHNHELKTLVNRAAHNVFQYRDSRKRLLKASALVTGSAAAILVTVLGASRVAERHLSQQHEQPSEAVENTDAPLVLAPPSIEDRMPANLSIEQREYLRALLEEYPQLEFENRYLENSLRVGPYATAEEFRQGVHVLRAHPEGVTPQMAVEAFEGLLSRFEDVDGQLQVTGAPVPVLTPNEIVELAAHYVATRRQVYLDATNGHLPENNKLPADPLMWDDMVRIFEVFSYEATEPPHTLLYRAYYVPEQVLYPESNGY